MVVSAPGEMSNKWSNSSTLRVNSFNTWFPGPNAKAQRAWGKNNFIWISTFKTAHKDPLRTAPHHLTYYHWAALSLSCPSVKITWSFLSSLSYLLLSTCKSFWDRKLREKFAESGGRERSRREISQSFGMRYPLDSLPSARRWQVVGFLWSHIGKTRFLQELLSGSGA